MPDEPSSEPARDRRVDRVVAVRRAVDQALSATADGTRTRAQELADDLGSVVTRLRGTLEELGSAGSAGAGALADEVQQAVGRLGRSLDDVRPASSDDLRHVAVRLEELDARVRRLEGAGDGADRADR